MASPSPLLQSSFNIESLDIFLHNGKKVRVDNASVIAFEYNEGLLQKYLTVTLTIADTTNMISQFLYGLEKVNLLVKDNTFNDKYEFNNSSNNGPLQIYEIHDKKVIDTTKIFTIELCRGDAIKNGQLRVSKKYSGVKSRQLVSDVIGNILGSKKGVNVSASVNSLTFIPPNSRPYEILVWSRNKYFDQDQKNTSSGGKYTSAGYFFYETYEQYNFVSIDSLAKKRKAKFTYTSGTGLGGTDEVYRMNHIMFKSNLNLMQNFDKGFYAGRIDYFDLVNCEVGTAEYNITENYKTWSKLGEQSDLPELYKVELAGKPTRVMTVAYNDDLFLESGKQQTDKKNLFLQTVAQSVSRFGVFTSQVLATNILGNLAIRAGDVLQLDFMDADSKLDKNYSGRYIVFETQHLYNRIEADGNFRTNLTLVRDSFGA